VNRNGVESAGGQPTESPSAGPTALPGVIVIRLVDGGGWLLTLLDCDPHQAIRVLKAALDAVTQRHEQEHASEATPAEHPG
jgi:hypothetical protein